MSAPAPHLHCVRCGKDVTYHQTPLDHRKELGRALLTLGLWLPVWLLITFYRTNVCDECGNAIDPG